MLFTEVDEWSVVTQIDAISTPGSTHTPQNDASIFDGQSLPLQFRPNAGRQTKRLQGKHKLAFDSQNPDSVTIPNASNATMSWSVKLFLQNAEKRCRAILTSKTLQFLNPCYCFFYCFILDAVSSGVAFRPIP